MNDDWDKVVDLEAVQYQKGIDLASQDARNEANSLPLKDRFGYQQGFMKGFAIGFEAGFIETSGTYMAEDSSRSETRNVSKIEEMTNKTKSIPNENIASVDFDEEIQRLRTLYRQLGQPYGPCPLNLGSDGQETKSHDW